MKIIFGYDNVNEKGIPVEPNGFFFDYKNHISPINLGYAGHRIICNEDTELQFHPHNSKLNYPLNITIQDTSKINEKYFYPIDVWPNDFWFSEKSKDIIINKKVVNDIQTNKAKILVLFLREGMKSNYGMSSQIITSWGDKYKLPKKSIIISSGNYTGDRIFHKNKYIKYIPHSIWEEQLRLYFNKQDAKKLSNKLLSKGDRKKLFLCYNRRSRFHRVKLINKLHREKLLEKGFVSLGGSTNFCLKNLNKELIDSLPMTIRNTDLSVKQVNTITFDDYADTYFSVITETEHINECNFPSEKIFKPIISFHPFFVVTSAHFLKMLKSLGYITFSKWFDESYDNEPNLDRRINMVVKEINRLSKLSTDELKNMLVEMYPILEHNHKTFFKRTSEKIFEKKLLKEMSNEIKTEVKMTSKEKVKLIMTRNRRK